MISYLYFVEIKSAALRNTAARSANGSDSHAGFAARAESIAFFTSTELALEYLATTSAWDEGSCCVRIEELLICNRISTTYLASLERRETYIFTTNSDRDLNWTPLLQRCDRVLKLLSVHRAFGVVLLQIPRQPMHLQSIYTLSNLHSAHYSQSEP